MKKLIMFFLPFILSSCFCKKNNFAKNELAWTHVYKNNKELIFKSNKENFDTLLIEKNSSYSNLDCRLIPNGTFQDQFFKVNLKMKNDLENSFIFSLYMGRKGYGRLLLKFLDVEYDKNLKKGNLFHQKLKLEHIGKDYDSVCYFERGLNLESYGIKKIKSFYWDKNDGLLKYETSKGEFFELYSVN